MKTKEDQTLRILATYLQILGEIADYVGKDRATLLRGNWKEIEAKLQAMMQSARNNQNAIRKNIETIEGAINKNLL